jgi:hypothetical protein
VNNCFEKLGLVEKVYGASDTSCIVVVVLVAVVLRNICFTDLARYSKKHVKVFVKSGLLKFV